MGFLSVCRTLSGLITIEKQSQSWKKRKEEKLVLTGILVFIL